MRIRSQFIISTAIFGLVILIIAASVIVTNQQLVRIEKQQQISGNIESGSDKLNILYKSIFSLSTDPAANLMAIKFCLDFRQPFKSKSR